MQKEFDFYSTEKETVKSYCTVKNNILGYFSANTMAFMIKKLSDLKELTKFDYLIEIKKTKKEIKTRRIFFNGKVLSKDEALLEMIDIDDDQYHKVYTTIADSFVISATNRAFEYNEESDVMVDIQKITNPLFQN